MVSWYYQEIGEQMIGKILTVPKADVIANKEYYEKEDNLLISIMSSYRPPIF